MTKANKLSIYHDVRDELLSMEKVYMGNITVLFAPDGEENVIRCVDEDQTVWYINDYPMTRLAEITAHLTRDVLKYWEQNPEEAKASGLV